MDLVNLLQSKTKDLNISVKSLRKTGEEYAKAYTNYRVELAKELLKLRNEGMPVTIAYDIARGNKEVAKLKFQEIAKESIYHANKEAINTIKLEIKIISSQLDKEWSLSGKGDI